jgi:hypothetical protein
VTRSPRRPARLGAVVLAWLLAGVLLAACSRGEAAPGGVIEWRELTIDLPDGWVEVDRTDTSLTVADAPRSSEPGTRGDIEVATQFTVEPDTTIDDWRDFVTDQDATLEEDGSTQVGDLPANLIQWSFVTNGVPTRERVVIVPSRELVIFQQPVPTQDETAAPEWFDEHVDEFDALLEGISFGAPEDFLQDG